MLKIKTGTNIKPLTHLYVDKHERGLFEFLVKELYWGTNDIKWLEKVIQALKDKLGDD
jgi:hypothetical protein